MSNSGLGFCDLRDACENCCTPQRSLKWLVFKIASLSDELNVAKLLQEPKPEIIKKKRTLKDAVPVEVSTFGYSTKDLNVSLQVSSLRLTF